MTPDAPSRRGVGGRRIVIGLGFVLVGLCAGVLWRNRSGVAVHVRNDETFAISRVEVRTSAGAYALGDLGPGDAASTVVGARGESSIQLAWTALDGSERVADANVYFEGSPEGAGMYGGTVAFVVSDGAARETNDVGTRVISPFSRSASPRARR